MLRAAAAAAGDGDDMWIPTGDPQLDSLLRLKTSVDHNNLLSNWTVSSGRNGGFCSWDFVTCDSSGTTVEVGAATWWHAVAVCAACAAVTGPH